MARARPLTSILCGALVASLSLPVLPARAAVGPLPLSARRAATAPAAVLGLDAEDAASGEAMTNALRKAAQNRGLAGGVEASLVELRLTMGCESDTPACLASGGQTLGVEKLVYGYFRPEGTGYELELVLLDVAGAAVESKVTRSISKGDMAAGTIDKTATKAIQALLGEEVADEAPPPRDPLTDTAPPPKDPKKADRKGSIWVGLEKPTPKWKWAGFGVGLTLTLVSLGTAIGTFVAIRPGGPIQSDIDDAVEDSLTNDNDVDDVTAMQGLTESCDIAKLPGEPLPDGRPTIRNKTVADKCKTGETLETLNKASWGIFAGTAAITLVFTGLLLLHRRKPKAQALRRRGFRLGAGPTHGGAVVSTGIRF